MKVAVKRLRSSDLSFFKAYFQRHPSAKQKGFNLDKAVLEAIFFPGLGTLLADRPSTAVHVDLMLYGPGLAGPETLSRKVKIDAKNFRLNGEFVANPVGDDRRYSDLAAGDFVVLEFRGDDLPSEVKAVVISARKPADKSIHAELARWFPQGSMRVITPRELALIVSRARPMPAHPFRIWQDAAATEEAALGSTEAIEQLKATHRKVDPDVLRRARASAEQAGQDGEMLLDHLMSVGSYPDISSHVWVSRTDPLSPFDFRVVSAARGMKRHIDAKSTSGAFENRIYLSAAEIRHALGSNVPYDLARLYMVTGTNARLRIARDIRPALEAVAASLASFPSGVSCDAISFDSSYFPFGRRVLKVAIT